MIASFKQFFTHFIEPGPGHTHSDRQTALQTATAALLVEMMRMDRRVGDEERASVVATLRRQFKIDGAPLDALLQLAEQQAQQASDYYQFTSLINQACSAEEKVQIIENMWVVAMSDGHLDAHEVHLMRKIADLLYVGHADYIAAKLRARKTMNLPAE